ncbi:MAG TPA: hypothetical protein VFG73_10335 [Rhodanobacteraceae bacterium]|nr:hypothetical protein [Rhodanobacteraceae bacterium]
MKNRSSRLMWVFLCAVAGVAVAAPATAQAAAPGFILKLVAKYKAAPQGHAPNAVVKYRYQGATVFFVPKLPCCDTMSTLYAADGAIICHPDGGMAVNGDAGRRAGTTVISHPCKCGDFVKRRKHGVEIWRRPGARPGSTVSRRRATIMRLWS